MRIGSVEDGPHALSAIGQIVVSERTGAIFITQRDGIRVFDAEGQYLRSIGRRGPGPGEFEGLALGWSGELLVAINGSPEGRAMLFTEDGSLVEDRRILADPPDGLSGLGYSRGQPYAPLADGYYLWTYDIGYESLTPGGLEESVPLVRTDGDGDDLILDRLDRSESGWMIETNQGRIAPPT